MPDPAALPASHGLGPPEGGMAWYAALFCSREQHSAIAAVHDIRTAILGAERPADEAPARLRLAWWGEELALLADKRARHPATQRLLACLEARDDPADLLSPARLLQELIRAAEDDLAGHGCQNLDDFRRYAFSSHGAALGALGCTLGLPQSVAIDIGRGAGLCLLAAEVLASLGAKLHHGGRLLLPCEVMANKTPGMPGVETGEHLDHALWLPVVAALGDICTQAARDLDAQLPDHGVAMRFTRILVQLHLGLCARSQRAWRRRIPNAPITCPAVKTLWIAWRTALKSS